MPYYKIEVSNEDRLSKQVVVTICSKLEREVLVDFQPRAFVLKFWQTWLASWHLAHGHNPALKYLLWDLGHEYHLTLPN